MAKFRQLLNEEGAIKDLWNSPWVGVPLWLASGLLTLYWFFHVPPPGYAIGALAVVAGIMSVREMKTLAKISWVFLLVCLLTMEFRAIDKDRADNDQKQRDFFEAQKKGFQGIATQSDTNSKGTAKGLDLSIQGLKEVLGTTQSIFKQTVPHADLRSTIPLPTNWPMPVGILNSGFEYRFNVFYGNQGSKAARLLRRTAKFYVEKPDDLTAQKHIAAQFEEDWKKVRLEDPIQTVTNGGSHMWSESRTFTDNEVERVKSKGETIYVVIRMEYLDPTGTWWVDWCSDYQIENSVLNLSITHPCQILMGDRYQPKQR